MLLEDYPQQIAHDATENCATNSHPRITLRHQAAIDAWHAKDEAERLEPLRLEQRAAYADLILKTECRVVRSYERGQTPERRSEKDALKSKGKRVRRLARSTPEEVVAMKKEAKRRAAESYERKKAAKAAEPAARIEDNPNFGRF